MNVAAKWFLSSASPDSFVGTSREELRQETGSRDRKRSKLHRLCAWGSGTAFIFSHSFTWIQLQVPKWNRSIETSDFSPIFSPAFEMESNPLLWPRVWSPYIPVLPVAAHMFHLPKPTWECLTMSDHSSSAQEPSRRSIPALKPKGREWASPAITDKHFKQHLGHNCNKKGTSDKNLLPGKSWSWFQALHSKSCDKSLETLLPYFLAIISFTCSVLSSFQEMDFCGWTLCFTPSVKP